MTDVPSDATNVKVQYRIKGTTDWKDASDSGNGIWTIEPVWSEGTANASGKMTYTVDNTTGVFAGNDYEYQLIYTDAQNTQQVISGEFQKSQETQYRPLQITRLHATLRKIPVRHSGEAAIMK